MSRRISTKKRFPKRDSKFDNLLVSLLVNRILKSGKKRLAKRIVYKAFELIEFRTNQNPILILEKAIRNISPRVQLKAKRFFPLFKIRFTSKLTSKLSDRKSVV